MHEELIAALKAFLPDAVEDTTVFRNELTIQIKKSAIKDVCFFLRDKHGFNYCVDILGADRFTEENRFEVVYNLMNLSTKTRLRLKVQVDENDNHLPSVVSVWPAANWFERETYDMIGVVFDGHPDLRRMYMPEDFEYHPLRKDFPLIGVPGSIPLPEFDKKATNKDAGERYNRGEQI